MRVLDLFSGIGGFSLGLEGTGGFQTVAFCEIEPFPRAVLRKHWPDVPIHEDVRELRGETVGTVDMICGGFPCQDISVAGKGAGLHGARSGLWSEFARLVGELRPRWVLAENVGALRTRGIDRVCSDLEGEGYAVWTMLVGAWAVGAPHRRERVWIVAHRDATLREQPWRRNGAGGTGAAVARGDGADVAHRDGWRRAKHWSGGLLDGERAASGYNADGRGERPVGDSERDGLRAGWRPGAEVAHEGRPAVCWPARPGEQQHEWEEPRLAFAGGADAGGRSPARGGRSGAGDAQGDGVRAGDVSRRSEQPMGSAVDGLPARLVRLARRGNREALKAYGNAVVPAVVATIGQAILAAEAGLNV